MGHNALFNFGFHPLGAILLSREHLHQLLPAGEKCLEFLFALEANTVAAAG
ncbi:MAG: hypothetical protein AAF528_04905 [Cyanobacteria bacterium P01_C01_bin.121]